MSSKSLVSRRSFISSLMALMNGFAFQFERSVQAQIGEDIYYPNWLGRAVLKAYEDVMGLNGLKAVLDLSGMSEYNGKYPPNDLERAFAVSDLVKIHRGLADMYGSRGGRGLAMRGGRITFANNLRDLTEIAVGIFRDKSVETRLQIGVLATANFFNLFTDQTAKVIEEDDRFLFTLAPFPNSSGNGEGCQICFWVQGLLDEGVGWFSDGSISGVTSVVCDTLDDGVCSCIISKKPIA